MNETHGSPPAHGRVAWITAATIALALVLLVAIPYLSRVFLIVFGGVLLAIMLDAPARLLHRLAPIPRPAAVVLVATALAAGAGVLLWLAGPSFGAQTEQLAQRLPADLSYVESGLRQHAWGRLLMQYLPAGGALVPTPSQLVGHLTGAFSTTLGVLANVALMLVVGVYLALEPGLYLDGAVRMLPPATRRRGSEVLGMLGRALRWWLVGRLAAMTVVGALTVIGLMVVGMPLPLALGLVAGTLSFVPFLGPIVSALPALLIALGQGPMEPAYVIAVYVVVQFLESNFITPIIQERVIALPAALLLVAQITMGAMFGLFGLLLATPLTVAALVLVQMLYIEDVLGERIHVAGEHGESAQAPSDGHG